MKQFLKFIIYITLALTFISCEKSTEPEVNISPVGVWSNTNGSEFMYLILLEDKTFLYAENDLSVISTEENGLEVGTYNYNFSTGMITFNIIYDDNAPGIDSGVGDIGNPVSASASVSSDGKKLSLFEGEIILNTENSSSDEPILGVWSKTDGAEFSYLILLGNNKFLYAENDLTVMSDNENGVEVGDYTYDAVNKEITFNITYDDNDPNNDSGVGDIGNPVVIDALISTDGKTLTLVGGELVLTK
jgi:hypothetical protein